MFDDTDINSAESAGDDVPEQRELSAARKAALIAAMTSVQLVQVSRHCAMDVFLFNHHSEVLIESPDDSIRSRYPCYSPNWRRLQAAQR